MKKHEPNCPEGEEFCLDCGLSYENEIHLKKDFGVCEGCGEDKYINQNHLCGECQILKDEREFDMPPLTEVRK